MIHATDITMKINKSKITILQKLLNNTENGVKNNVEISVTKTTKAKRYNSSQIPERMLGPAPRGMRGRLSHLIARRSPAQPSECPREANHLENNSTKTDFGNGTL